MKKKLLVSLFLLLIAGALFAAITREEAEDIALSDSALSRDSVSYLRSSLDWEHGERIYDVEFHHEGTEYDYEIAQSDGKILSFDQETERIRRRDDSSSVGRDEALAIALDNAGLGEDEVSRIRVERDDERRGRVIYEIEFRTDDYEYDYEVDGDGIIISYSFEKYGRLGSNRDEDPMAREAAETIISSYMPENAELRRLERDYDDGIITYEASSYLDGVEYEIEINGVSGELLKYSEETRMR